MLAPAVYSLGDLSPQGHSGELTPSLHFQMKYSRFTPTDGSTRLFWEAESAEVTIYSLSKHAMFVCDRSYTRHRTQSLPIGADRPWGASKEERGD